MLDIMSHDGADGDVYRAALTSLSSLRILAVTAQWRLDGYSPSCDSRRLAGAILLLSRLGRKSYSGSRIF